MSKNKATILMLIVIGIGVYQSGINMPLSINSYSPPAVIFMSPMAESVFVFGSVRYSNGIFADDVKVRLYATDQLIEDVVFTDSEGFFVSSVKFQAGQILTIVFDDDYSKRCSVFISYDADVDFNLGDFIVWV